MPKNMSFTLHLFYKQHPPREIPSTPLLHLKSNLNNHGRNTINTTYWAFNNKQTWTSLGAPTVIKKKFTLSEKMYWIWPSSSLRVVVLKKKGSIYHKIVVHLTEQDLDEKPKYHLYTDSYAAVSWPVTEEY